MRGVVFTGEREIELMEFPDPTPGADEVVVEMKASGMCGSDLHQYRRPKSGGGSIGGSWCIITRAARFASTAGPAGRNCVRKSRSSSTATMPMADMRVI